MSPGVPGGGGKVGPGDMPAGGSSVEFIVLLVGVALVIVAALIIVLVRRSRKHARGSFG